MELRVLNYFLVVAREENITKAAQLLHITQPTLSRQLQQLEDELGVTLFRRVKHSIQLTTEGHLLRHRAQEMVDLAHKTKAELFSVESDLGGEIAIGCGESQNMSFISQCIKTFREKHPLVTFQIYSAHAEDIKERLQRGVLDLGLLMEPVDVASYEYLRLNKKSQWGMLVHETDSLASKDYITHQDIELASLLLPSREAVSKELKAWLGDSYDSIHIVGHYNLLFNAMNMVAHKVAYALCLELAVTYKGVKFIPLSPTLETGAVLVWKKNPVFSPAAQAFISLVKEKYIHITKNA
ncbi:LysR family transcriptional regulator [Veillonella intestinalis]|uniref:LysR family transcriptional regulator n=1 Tax=Veillonella intestinalis TaxID=2941341 RepID=UPI00203F1A6D|nr:LysR family transcriptional regulator [Veillonella intestinalis]